MATKTTPAAKPFVASGVPRDLIAMGFQPAEDEPKLRLLVSSEGQEKTGKSEFWMSAPSPIACINLDIGTEGVVEKWAKKKNIWMLNFSVPPVVQAKQGEYVGIWARTKAAYDKILAHPDVRTVVVDTNSDWWELARLAEFGSLSPAVDVKRAYPPLNMAFRSIIRAAYQTDKNLILTHKVSEKWKKNAAGVDAPSGEFERAGFKEDGYLIQVNISHHYEDGKFRLRVKNCRQNMDIAGFDFFDRECSFPDLASMVFGNSKSDWK